MLRGLGSYWWRHRWRWLVCLGCTAAAVACSLEVPRILGQAIDDLRAGGQGLDGYVARLLFFAGASALLFIGVRRSGATASRTIAYEVRRDLFHRLTLLEPGYFHSVRVGDLMNRFTGDLSAVQEMLGFGTVQVVSTAFMLTLSLTFMLRVSTQLGLVVLVVFPIIAGMLLLLLRVMARRYAAAQEQQSLVSAKAQESFSGIRVVKGYAVEDREQRDYDALNREYRRRALSLARVEGPLWATVSLLMNLVFVAVVVIASRSLLAGEHFAGLTVGKFVSFITYLFALSWPLLSVGVMSNILQRGAVSWGRLREILATAPKIASPRLVDRAELLPSLAPAPATAGAVRPGLLPSAESGAPALERAGATEVRGEIRFEGVSLHLGRSLLQNIDLTIPRGRTVGITGRTGSGKSLLASLVSRLLDPTSGVVRVDGKDVRDWSLSSLRQGIGVVPQEPFLFSTTLAENIAFGLSEVPPGRVKWAAHVAGLESDLAGFPQGLETVIGERGVTLSGGQRQRTALARAVARMPSILILDDALSAVDTETESRILSQLKAVLAGRTVLLIGHRVSMLRHADEIVVLEHGRIVERGTHDELISRGGKYAEIDQKQRLEEQTHAAG